MNNRSHMLPCGSCVERKRRFGIVTPNVMLAVELYDLWFGISHILSVYKNYLYITKQ